MAQMKKSYAAFLLRFYIFAAKEAFTCEKKGAFTAHHQYLQQSPF
jgi:hypothetical protein